MSLQIGQQLGSYEITSLLGKGGMGEVYRASDTKLKREVAIKILPDEFARDPDRVSRFQREAELLASLNNPNIAAIYDIGEASGSRFLVLELVEGDTLADRLGRARIPLEEALRIAKDICEALEAAHEKGVVHRDLKPGNVKITPDGKVKVLDFGLAKALEGAPANATMSNSPTLTFAGTNPGVILGTAGYMSPEQARGHNADQRSDVFSFGCVVYEMLTGRRAFEGETVTDVIASVVARDPDYKALPPSLHPKTEDLIRRCLAKNRKERWHAIADVRVELDSIVADPSGVKLAESRDIPRPTLLARTVPLAIAAVLAAAIAVVAATMVMTPRPSAPVPPMRFSFVLPDERFTNNARHMIALSPDGMHVVYVANQQLHLRSMGDLEARPIQGTSQNPSRPFFSPDGRWIGYLARQDQKIKKIAITGGAAVSISDFDDLNSGFGPVWNADDYIYIGQPQGIVRVSANGGKLEKIITLKEAESAHRPQLLPGGDWLLFTLATGSNQWDTAQIVVQSLKTGERKVLIPGGSDARYVSTGHIVYALASTVLAIGFDAGKLQTRGGPVPIVEGVRRSGSAGGGGADANFAFSDNGSMVYVPGTQATANDLVLTLVERSGTRKLLNVPPGRYSQPRISPNGRQLAVSTNDGRNTSISIYDLNDSAPIRKLTFEGQNLTPLWTRDSQRVVFTSDREGEWGLFSQRVESGSAERLAKVEQGIRPQPESFSTDGKVLIFTNRSSQGGNFTGAAGISSLSLGSNQKPGPVIKPPATNASLSPNGRWLAYTGLGATRPELYVEPFPPTGEKHQITREGGDNALWSPDGKQLFYLALGETRRIMAVDVQTEKSFVFGKTVALPIEGVINPGPRPYDITPDGKYFVVMYPKSQTDPVKAPPEQINITLNWFEELKQRVPVR